MADILENKIPAEMSIQTMNSSLKDFSSKIYIYNRRNKETYEYDIKSNFTDNLSEDLDKNVNTTYVSAAKIPANTIFLSV